MTLYGRGSRVEETNLELKFIDGLGNRPDSDKWFKADRVELLKRYLKGCMNRTNWGHINRETVITHIQQSILEEKHA